MSTVSRLSPSTRRSRAFAPGSPWVRRILNLGIALIVGAALGLQIYHPNPRILKALIGMAVLYAAWRFPIPVSLSAFLLLFPYPFAIAYGSSNTVFVFLISTMWLGQIVFRTTHPVGKTMLDLPILFLVAAHLLSFNNVANAFALGQGVINFSIVVAGIFVYYLLVHTVRDEVTLQRLVRIVVIMAVSTYCVALWELIFPGRPMIRGWILGSTFYSETAIQRGLRVGGPWQDFELYAEFCAMMLPITLFHLLRAKVRKTRIIWGLVTFLTFFVLMATVTRGATIALIIGLIYLLFRTRKSMSMTTFMLTVTAAISVFMCVEFVLANFTVSGSVLERLLNTKIVKGLPDSRTFWPQILERCKEHIWVGHGPYYEFGEYGREKLRRYFWPHNGYLYYLHTLGILGTGSFLWIVLGLFVATGRKAATSLTDPDYTKALLLVWNVVLIIFIVDQAKIEYLRNTTYQYWPWIMFALSVATLRVLESKAAAKEALPEPVPAGKSAGSLRQAGPAPRALRLEPVGNGPITRKG